MNPLTLVKRTQKITSTEAALGLSESASWHAAYSESAYVFVGGIPYDLTEGDLLAVFAQYGEVVDVNLVRDKGTGKSKGFAFVAYEDQRSTVLAVDNLNGAKLLGRIVRVDHVSKYKKKAEEEDDEEEQRKREARGVCRAFQKGECTRGASCKFSHDEQRSANTGWGAQDSESRWNHDKHVAPARSFKSLISNNRDKALPVIEEDKLNKKLSDRGGRPPRHPTHEDYDSSQRQRNEPRRKDQEGSRSDRNSEKRLEKPDEEDGGYKRTGDKHRGRYKLEGNQVEDVDNRGTENRPKHDRERGKEDLDYRGTEKRSRHDREQEQEDRYRTRR